MKNNKIDKGRNFDWGRTSVSYSKYRDIYPDELYKKLEDLGVGKPGKSWLDLGTGTGILPINLYQADSDITGVDISSEQIRVARKTAAEKNMDINYLCAPAEKTGLPDDKFDVITAAQCFMYFDQEQIKKELIRIGKPGARLIKIYMGWLKESEITVMSTNMVKKHNPNWLSGNSMMQDMKNHLFEVEMMDSFFSDISFTRDSWHGRMRATRGVEASMSPEEVEMFDKEHREMLEKEMPGRFNVRHKIFITMYSI